MPPKITISYEAIVNAGYNYIAKNGMKSMTVRNLAKELNCSTQPIYYAFKNLNELYAAIAKKVLINMQQYITNNQEYDYPTFVSNILGYVEFSYKEPNLYELLFSTNVFSFEDAKSYVSASNPVELNLLIYAHGIILMRMFNTLPLDWLSSKAMILGSYNAFKNADFNNEDK